MSESYLMNLQVQGTATLLKRNWMFSEFCELFKNKNFAEDLWAAGSETPVRLFKNTFFNRTFPVAASDSFRFPACNFIKKETPAKMFICEFCKIFKNIFRQKHLRMTASCVYLWILRSFSDHLFYTAPLESYLFNPQVARFQPPDTVKKYFTSAFQAFYTKTRNSYSKAFIYLKSLKIICEEVNLYWSRVVAAIK